MSQLPVYHFTDILCVWAFVGQARIDELLENHPDEVLLDTRFVPVFGNARERLSRNWADRGGLAGYAAHVRSVCEQFDHVQLHEDTWELAQPNSSLNAHIFLAAIRHLEKTGEQAAGRFRSACWEFRRAFFCEGRDIGMRRVHYEIAEQLGLPIEAIERSLGNGGAHAELAADFALAQEFDVKMSPTLVLNEGRQRLAGNVGYRVIAANVRELLHPRGDTEASWC